MSLLSGGTVSLVHVEVASVALPLWQKTQGEAA